MSKFFLNHFSCTPLVLRAFRIAIGFIGVFDLISRWPLIKELYSEEGIVTCKVALIINGLMGHLPTLNCLSPSDDFQYALLIVGSLAFLSFAFGRFTKLSAFVAWVIFASFRDRNILASDSADALLLVVLFWSIFIPWQRLATQPQAISVSTEKTSVGAMSWRDVRLPCALMLLKSQILLMHIFTALVKTGPAWVKDFTAVELALNSIYYGSGLADFILNHPSLGRALTVFSIGTEYLAPILLISPVNSYWGRKLRWAGIILFTILHVGIFISLNIFLFQPIVIICLIPFIPPPVAPQAVAVSPQSSKTTGTFLNFFLSLSIAEFFLILLFVGAVTSTNRWTEKLNANIVLNTLHLSQRWYMFAPEPLRENAWVTATGTLASGEKIELASTDFRSMHHRKRFFLLMTTGFRIHAKIYAHYFCRQNVSRPPNEQFEKVVVYRLTKYSKKLWTFTYCN